MEISEDKNQFLPAFARDIAMREHSSIQDPHYRMYYHPDDVSGDKLTIEAIPPFYTVQSVMKLLIAELDKRNGNQSG